MLCSVFFQRPGLPFLLLAIGESFLLSRSVKWLNQPVLFNELVDKGCNCGKLPANTLVQKAKFEVLGSPKAVFGGLVGNLKRKTMDEKVKSCLMMGALGDAYGSKYEQSDIPSGDSPWFFTDDTQLTMATCESMMEKGIVDPDHLAQTFRRWYRDRRLSGLGASTLKALVELVGGGHWASVGAKGEMAAGNGAAMRIGPLAFVLDPKKDLDRELIRHVCRITHHNEEAYVGALAVVWAIRLVQNQQQNFIPAIIKALPDSRVRDRLEAISQNHGLRIRDIGRKYGSSGYVVDSIPLALFAAQQAPEIGIQSMMKEIVAAAGDTDTNCSIAGQIAGVHMGADAMPAEWMKKLRLTPKFDEFYETIRKFSAFVSNESGIQTLF
jgi:ADP-ribosyl-[dinitrogen reductase] hydrolase